MTDDRDSQPSFATRIVPTLTEVVPVRADAAEPLSEAVAAPISVAVPKPADRAGETAARVLAMLQPELDRQIAEAVSRALHEQMQGLHARVQQTVAGVVRDAVDKALREADERPAR